LTANWQSDLKDINSDKIVQLVKQLASVVTIKSLRTTGYNEVGSAGCEIRFVG
jgi:hypothetical protein